MIFLSDGNSKVRISCFSSAATPLPQMDGVATATAAVVYSLKVRIRRMQSWQRNHSMCAFHQHPIEPPPRDIPRHRAQRNAPWNIEMYDVPNIEWCMCKCIASDQMLNSLQRKYYFVGAQMHISVYLSVSVFAAAAAASLKALHLLQACIARCARAIHQSFRPWMNNGNVAARFGYYIRLCTPLHTYKSIRKHFISLGVCKICNTQSVST